MQCVHGCSQRHGWSCSAGELNGRAIAPFKSGVVKFSAKANWYLSTDGVLERRVGRRKGQGDWRVMCECRVMRLRDAPIFWKGVREWRGSGVHGFEHFSLGREKLVHPSTHTHRTQSKRTVS